MKLTKTCPKCKGKGTIPNPAAVGAELRRKRLAAQMSLRSLAEALGISAPFLFDCELGRRSLSQEHLTRARLILK